MDSSPILLMVTPFDVPYLSTLRPLLKGRKTYCIEANPDTAAEIELYEGVKVLSISSPQIILYLIRLLRANDINPSITGLDLYMNGRESHISSLILLDSYIVFHMDDSWLTDSLVRSYNLHYGHGHLNSHGNWPELKLSKDGFISTRKLWLLQLILKLFRLRIHQTGNLKLLFVA